MRRRNFKHSVIKYYKKFDNDPRYSANIETSLSYLLDSGVIASDVGAVNDYFDEDYSYVGLTEISEKKRGLNRQIEDFSKKIDEDTIFDDDLNLEDNDIKITKTNKKK